MGVWVASGTSLSSATGVAVGNGGSSSVGRALVGAGISVRICATRVAISSSDTGGGSLGFWVKVQAVKTNMVKMKKIKLILRFRGIGKLLSELQTKLNIVKTFHWG
jgi:hypothetical protein